MNNEIVAAGLAVFLSFILATPVMAAAAAPDDELPTREAERLLGSADETAQWAACLPFTRQFSAGGIVTGSLTQSAASAGVPPAAMMETMRALGTAIDLERELQDGDRFHVRYEQAFTVEQQPIGVGRVLWVELRTQARGTIAVHRFRTHDRGDRFWLASGQEAATAAVRLPLEGDVNISSGFGMRADPLRPSRASSRSGGQWNSTGQRYMHEGVDLVAPTGTPVYAAADGVVLLAGRDGGYGNAVRIDHGITDRTRPLGTVYGHLSRFAPGIVAGALVAQGELIGFVGSTGRSTGAHLHFELLKDGKPVNPLRNPATRRGQLAGADLARFRRQMAAALDERERELELAERRAAVPDIACDLDDNNVVNP
jgi:murein DD-endopeptidase MepM/ murein hydrolase activator NlpD